MKKILKSTLICLMSVIGIIVVVVVGYISYLSISYNRIEDKLSLNDSIVHNSDKLIDLNEDRTYKISTFNIGFGAYTRDFTFFLDTGKMLNSKKVVGKRSCAKSKEIVLENTNGCIDIISSLNTDFSLFQEVDLDSKRSFRVNQIEMINQTFSDKDSVFASNFHSSYLFYPLNSPIGDSNSGIVTLSKYQINNSMRHSFPIDNSFPTKFFDLDRCFSSSEIKIKDSTKSLIIVNVHFSAYDEGGIIRKKQISVFNEYVKEEYNKGNYVVIGGDFNHDIANSINKFPTQQYPSDWVQVFDYDMLAEGFSFATSNNHPTCRSTEIKYEEGISYTIVVDGFLVSDNIEVINVENIVSSNGKDTNFLYSDHNPVCLEFKLK